jgi:hypothetical protein
MAKKISEHVKEILIERGLEDGYIADKMELFNDEQTRLEQLRKAKFLDQVGRTMLAERFGARAQDLNGFYDTFDLIV